MVGGNRERTVLGTIVRTRLLAGLAVLALSAGIAVADASGPRQGGLEAFFTKRSYEPGERARLAVNSSASSLTIRIFRCGPERGRTDGRSSMRGVPVERTLRVRWGRSGWRSLPIRLEYWPSGLYFARVQAGSHAFFAPFVLRASASRSSRVAVVLPTNTWQAYNFRDDDGDGVPNTWYASEPVTTVQLARPFLNRGVPPHFRTYDLGFLRWLAVTGKYPDFLADEDLERVPSGRNLLRRYDLVVFPGHHEYVTAHEYDVMENYHDRGGNIMFLSANNFFRRVIRSGNSITRAEMFRELGRPEARWIGAQYVDWNQHAYPNRSYFVNGYANARWFFDGTRLGNGSRFGLFGIEIDARTPESPPGTRVLAVLTDLFGPGKTGEMVYHETPAGAKVFAAGAFTLGGSALVPPMSTMIENLWVRLSIP
jgi:hypothetical protein